MKKTILATLLCTSTLALAQEKITYDDHVQPLLKANCFKCHNQDKAKADLDLSTYSALMAGGSSGPSVVAGDPDASYLYTTMNHTEEPFMPEKSPKRPDAELEVVRKWILGGLLESSSSIAMVPKKPSVDLTLGAAPTGKPEGPPPMPQDLLLEPPLVTDRANAVVAMAASPWAPLVAIAGQQQVVLYNTDTYQPAGILPFPEGEALTLMFSRNAQLLLAGGGKPGSNGRVVVWNIKDGYRVLEVGEDFDAIMAADISGDQAYIATGGTDKYIKVFATNEDEQVHNVKKHTEWVSALQFSPDAVLLATADRNGNLYVWEAETMQQFYELRGHKGKITGLSWRADSNVLASASEDGTVKLWNMHDGKQIKSFTAHGGGALSIAYSMDGKLVTSGRDNMVKVWDGNGTKLKDLKGFADMPLTAVFTHDSKKVISGDWTGNAIVWDIESAKEIARIAPNPPSINARIAQIEKAMSDQKVRFDQLTAEAKKQTDLLAKATAEHDAHKKKVADLAAQKANSDKEVAEAKTVLASLQKPADVAPLQNKVHAAATTRKQTEDALNKARAEADRLAKVVPEKQKPVVDATAVAAAEKALAEAPNEEEKTKRAAHLANVKKGTVNQEAVKQAQAHAEQAKQQVAKADAAFKQADAALNQANTELTTLRKQNEEKQAMIAAAQKRLDDANQRLAAIVGQIDPVNKAAAAAEKKRADTATAADAAKKAAEAATPNPAPFQKQLAFWKAAQFNVTVHKAKDAVSEKQQAKLAYEQAARDAAAAAKKAEAEAAAKKAELDKLKAEYEKMKANAGV